MTSPVPTIPTPQDYLDAEEAADKVLNARSWPTLPREFPLFLAEHPAFIAAVDSAFAAGWRAALEQVVAMFKAKADDWRTSHWTSEWNEYDLAAEVVRDMAGPAERGGQG